MMSGKGARLLWLTVIVAGCLSLLPNVALAGTVGQIKGTLTDKKNGEPIIGASVRIDGTKIGTITDFDGKYVISRVEPGKYVLIISTLGYNTLKVENVTVSADETSEVNGKLEQKVTELDKIITVKAKRDVIQKFETSSQVTFDQESIKHRPVQSVDNLLKQVAGVRTTSTGELFIRGGRAGEVAFIVDGVPMSDPLGGLGQSGANLSLVAGSIQEIQIIKDGFDPEYGDALSGIVNIRSQTGLKDNTRFNIQFMTDDLGNPRLNTYSRNYDFLRFSLSGPDPIITSKILPALGINWFVDKEFTYYLYAEIEKHDGIYQFEEFDSFATRRQQGAISLLGFIIPDRNNNRYNIQANFRFRPRQNMKFVFSYKNWETNFTQFGAGEWSYRYTAGTAPVRRVDQSSISLELNHAISRNTWYEAIVSYTKKFTSSKPGDPDNPGYGKDPDQFVEQSQWETYDDLNGNGVYDAPEPLFNLFPDTASFGTNFSGPAYTFTEYQFIQNNQAGGGSQWADFRFNNNGETDSLEGEAFLDLNGNGVWDSGDLLNDKNGNGLYDISRADNVNNTRPEPFTDGDSVLGEPFTDLNANGIYEANIDVFVPSADPTINQDLNYDGRYNGPSEDWTPGIPYFDRNGNGVYDAPNNRYDPGEPFFDRNGNGKYDAGGETFLEPLNYLTNITWSQQFTRRYRGELKLFRQQGPHELKAGMYLQRDLLRNENIVRPYQQYNGRFDGGAYPDRGAFRDFYEYEPWSGAFYFRDKLEYGSMIASLGFRWDFYLQDVNRIGITLKEDDRGLLIEGDRHKISPRIGFSYPISDKAKVYFNYGHFFQLPRLTNMFSRNTASSDQNSVLGNPNLTYAKTIQYSFGVKYKVSENYALDIEGYFKDEFDKVVQTRFQEESGLIRNRFDNGDYGRGRGLELTIDKIGGGYVSGSISYTYAFSFGKASEARQQALSEFEFQREPLTEAPLANDIRHSLKSVVQFYIPSTVKPRLFGIPILNAWSFALETIIESGAPFTPARSFPGISQQSLEDIERNSLRLPGTAQFDLRFTKELKIASVSWDIILQVENVLNRRNVIDVYPQTGRADTKQNQNQVIFGGTELDANPYNWDRGRQIRLGLELTL